MNCEELLDASGDIGVICGGIVGFSLGVWTSVILVEPFFKVILHSTSGATTITIAIFLCGGAQSFILGGIFAGIAIAPMIIAAGASIAITTSQIADSISIYVSNGFFRFFGRDDNNAPVPTQQPEHDDANPEPGTGEYYIV